MKHWYFLTMLSLVALLGYATNLPWWQATLLGALLNMWEWTLLSPRLVNESKKDGGIELDHPARYRASTETPLNGLVALRPMRIVRMWGFRLLRLTAIQALFMSIRQTGCLC